MTLQKNITPYKWQLEAVNKYNGKGTIKAVPGAGKTFVGKMIADKVKGNILVTTHSNVILDQWRLALNDVENVTYSTFQTVSKQHYTIDNINLLIVDEAHRSVSEKFINLYSNIKYNNILGLTATPNDACIKMCGDILSEINYDKANVAHFTVTFHGIELTFEEMSDYKKLSRSISNMINKDSDEKNKAILRSLIMKRRSVVYYAKNRTEYTKQLVTTLLENNKKVLVITQRIEQANNLAQYFNNININNIVYHSEKQDDLDIYKNSEVNLCLSVGMLKEGFNDVDTDAVVISSTALSEQFQVQSIGRGIRYKEGKSAQIHIILANDTTDTRALNYRHNYDFELINIKIPRSRVFEKIYYSGTKYSFSSTGEIWKRAKNTRINVETHSIVYKLKKYKPKGGSFVVADEGVFTIVDNEIIKVIDKKIKLVERSIDWHPLSYNEMFGSD